jgi:aspartate carbamoyltransferase catalytic subunit
MTTSILGKDLTGLEHMTPEQIRLILDTAEPFKEVSERPIKKVPALRGKTIVNLFFEASTRTRISFEFAEKRFRGYGERPRRVVGFKGETLVDTATSRRCIDGRSATSSGAAEPHTASPRMINAGDGSTSTHSMLLDCDDPRRTAR